MTGLRTKTDFHQLFEKDLVRAVKTLFLPWSQCRKKNQELLDVSVQTNLTLDMQSYQ